MRKLSSFLLIVSFVVLSTPRDFWHSHDHEEDHIEAGIEDDGTSNEEDCFACDYDLSLFTKPSVTFHFQKKNNFVEKKVLLTQIDKIYIQFNYLRGPPSFA